MKTLVLLVRIYPDIFIHDLLTLFFCLHLYEAQDNLFAILR